MLLQDSYKNGFQRERFEAYGIRLYPLTLGHVQFLAETECNAVLSGNQLDYSDIVLICSICGFELWDQAREVIENDDLHVDQVARHIAKNKSEDESKKVVDYFVYYLAKPETKSMPDMAGARVPWWWSYAEFLQTEMGRSEADAWNTICCDAFCYYASFASRNGSEEYLTARECFFANQFKQGKTVKDLFEEGLI